MPIDSYNPINRVTTYCANSTFTLYRYVNAASQKYLDDNSRVTRARFNLGLCENRDRRNEMWNGSCAFTFTVPNFLVIALSG